MSLIQHCPQQQPRRIEYTPCSSRQTGLKRQKERIKYLSIKFSKHEHFFFWFRING